MSSFRTQPKSGFWSIERVVAALTPLFSAAAGFVTTLIGKLIPGTGLSRTDLTALFIAGATIAGGAALKWLHGRQKFVNFTTDADRVVEEVIGRLQSLGLPIAGIERALQRAFQAHETVIIDTIGRAIGAPASAEEIAKQIVQNLWPKQAASGQPPVVAS